jgi:hypothetical protein
VKPDEIKKIDAYFKRLLNPQIVVKARPRKDDSAEVYLGEEFLGVVYVDAKTASGPTISPWRSWTSISDRIGGLTIFEGGLRPAFLFGASARQALFGEGASSTSR